MNVVMDHREPDSMRALFGPDDSVSVAQLDVGDYRIDGFLIFERKTMNDFSRSIIDGRLFSQVFRLKKSSLHPVVIIEGRNDPDERGGVSREAQQGALINLTVFHGIPVVRSADPSETVRLMRYCAAQGNRALKGGVQRYGYAPKKRRNRQLYFLQGFPGIGKSKAEALLDHFGSIEAIIQSDETMLAEVGGIGSELARSMRDLIEHRG